MTNTLLKFRVEHISRTMLALMTGSIAVVVAIVFWMFQYVGEQADNVALEQRRETLSRALASRAERFAREINAIVVNDDTAAQAAGRPNATWLRETVSEHLFRIFDHRLVVMYDSKDDIAFATYEGRFIQIDRLTPLLPALSRAVGDLRAIASGSEHSHSMLERRILHEDGTETTFRQLAHIERVFGEPAVMTSSLVVPERDGRLISSPPPIVVTVRLLDDDQIARLGAEFGFPGLAWIRNGAIEADRAEHTILDEEGNRVGVLQWDFVSPTAAFRDRVMPAVLATFAFLAGITALGIALGLVSRRRLMTSRVEAQRQAHEDQLTGLANRRAFRAGLDIALDPRRETAGPVTLMLLDLDRFKELNDTLGHAVGDIVLRQVAKRVTALATSADMVARMGGDEFAIVLSGATVDRVDALAEAILDAFFEPFALDRGAETVLGVSIGIAFAEGERRDASELFRCADLALYKAKQRGRGRSVHYDHAMDAEIHRRRLVELELRKALAQGGLSLAYQPQVSASGRAIGGVEALVRWQHSELGSISPGEFIPVAESCGLMPELGLFVLRRACLDMRDFDGLMVAVNVSPEQFRRGDFVATVESVLTETGFPHHRLELELTESALVGDEDGAAEQIAALRRAGLRVALDDFGTGYSSLAYLRRFGFDKLKIDRSFVKDVETVEQAASIVQAIVSMSRALGLSVTVEGAETEAQCAALTALGCDQIQGYAIARPMPLDALQSRLARQAA